MNQAVAFGLLFGGGIVLTSALSGKGLSDVVQGKATSIPNQGDQFGLANQLGQGVSGVGSVLSGQLALAFGTGAASGYVDPFAKATLLTPERIDQGQDFSMAPGSPILAPGDSKVLGVLQNWYHGQPYVAYQLTSGPQAGRNYYIAEQFAPATTTPGATIKQGQPLGTYAHQGTGIEIGWAAPNWTQTLAQASGNTGDATHGNSPAGLSFHQFLIDLGAVK